jgi:hypothetical protein
MTEQKKRKGPLYGIARRCAVLLPGMKQSRIVASPSQEGYGRKGRGQCRPLPLRKKCERRMRQSK